MTKLIVFDLFGVVIDSHSKTTYNVHNAREDIAHYCNFDLNEFLSFFSEYQFGIASTILFEQLVQKYIRKCKSQVTVDEFKKIYKISYGKITCYEKVIKFIDELQKKKVCETAILSKLCVLDKSFIEDNLKLNQFDYLFLSCDIGMEKTNIDVYKYVEKITKHNGYDILFIDDNSKNIQIAQSLGWNTCQATGDELEKIYETCNLFLAGNTSSILNNIV